jgi:glycerol-3-phosphate dehydrogenase (NAD(P)+)
MESVVEGVETCRVVVQLAQQHGVEMPIANAVHGVLFSGLSPRSALQELMRRNSGEERI